MDIILLSRKKT